METTRSTSESEGDAIEDGFDGIRILTGDEIHNKKLRNIHVKERTNLTTLQWSSDFKGKKIKLSENRSVTSFTFNGPDVIIGLDNGHLLSLAGQWMNSFPGPKKWTGSYPGHQHQVDSVSIEQKRPNPNDSEETLQKKRCEQLFASVSYQEVNNTKKNYLQVNKLTHEEARSKITIEGGRFREVIMFQNTVYAVLSSHSTVSVMIFNSKLQIISVTTLPGLTSESNIVLDSSKHLFFAFDKRYVLEVDTNIRTNGENTAVVHALNIQSPGSVKYSTSSTAIGDVTDAFTCGDFHRTQNIKQSWYQVDLGENTIVLSHYAIKTLDENIPKGWLLQATNDKKAITSRSGEDQSGWETLDRREDEKLQPNAWCCFPVFNQQKGWRAFRIVQTQPNKGSTQKTDENVFSLQDMELFGHLNFNESAGVMKRMSEQLWV